MSDVRHFILATAGHVDHGKSALVKALSGTDPDRLPEEKKRGITIDLGFAHLRLQSPVDPFSSAELGIVDVPGHEDFVKNMVAGVGSIDLALLVVAADDGWMQQTEEHLQILTYLGVTQAVIALTKIDLARDEESVKGSIQERLSGTPFAGAPIVPTSIVSGRGLNELKSELAAVAAKMHPQRDINKPRLPIDRVFNLRGIGIVVTGTLTGGTLRRGQNVVVQPRAKTARIRNIQSHNINLEVVGPGARTALNLPNLVPGQDIRRGDIVTIPGCGDPSTVIDARLEVSPRAMRPVKEGTRVWVHHGSGSVAGTVAFSSAKELNPGEQSLARLLVETPVFAFAGDCFVLRDWSEQHTLGGGVVLDADADKTVFRSSQRVDFLKRRAAAPNDARAHIVSQLSRDGAAKRSQLPLKSHFSDAEVSEAVSRLAGEGIVAVIGEFAVDCRRWGAMVKRAAGLIDRTHQMRPECAGMALNDLRAALRADLPADDLFDALIKELCRSEFVRAGDMIHRVTHRPALPEHLRETGAKLRAELARKPFDPPSRKELAPDSASEKALWFLIGTGEVIEISSEVVMLAESERQATRSVCQFLRDRGPATVSDLRQTIGTSRRVIIPLLERLDRTGVTRRVEDRRVLRQK